MDANHGAPSAALLVTSTRVPTSCRQNWCWLVPDDDDLDYMALPMDENVVVIGRPTLDEMSEDEAEDEPGNQNLTQAHRFAFFHPSSTASASLFHSFPDSTITCLSTKSLTNALSSLGIILVRCKGDVECYGEEPCERWYSRQW
jgi:hypothetical protein